MNQEVEDLVNYFYSRLEQYAPPEIMEADKADLGFRIQDLVNQAYRRGMHDFLIVPAAGDPSP
jgi:hypothetical protein